MPLFRIALGLSLAALPFATVDAAERSNTPAGTKAPFRVETYAKGLAHPWGLAFLPDGQALVTERSGRLRLVATNGSLSEPLRGVPKVFAQGQGGLLDVALAPDFEESRAVYLTFSEPGQGGAGTALARGILGDKGLEDTKVIWRQKPKVSGPNHWGSRIAFRPDGTLFVTLGDRFKHRDKVQDLSSTIGKVVRLTANGGVPGDNPFVDRDDALPEIWSYGHRNAQSAAVDADGQLWTVEHGARGGDELNNPQAGKNYGWPVITYGVDYSGEKIGEGTAKQGMEQPAFWWDPVIAPSGAQFYSGDAFADWKGNLLVGGLRTQQLVRLEIENGTVKGETRYDMNDRIRDVVQGPDGFVYLLTDDDEGRILRLEPSATR